MAAACGDGSHARPDAAPPPADAPPPPADAAQPDATLPDGGMGATAPVIDDGAGSSPTSWSFGAAPVGTPSAVTLFLRGTGTGPSRSLVLTLTGANAGDFAIAAGSTCSGVVLAVGDQCAVRLAFVASGTGPCNATLQVIGADTPLVLSLDGSGIAPSVVTSSAATIDFGPSEIGAAPTAAVLVTNRGASAVTLGARRITAGFLVNSDNCPATLAAGAACQIVVKFIPAVSGLAVGTLVVPSSAVDLSVPLRGAGLRRITVTVSGGGTGTIASVPAGPLYIGDAILTATPTAGGLFHGWSAPCTGTGPCISHDGPSVNIDANIAAPGAKPIAVSFAGAARGFVFIVDTSASTGSIVTCTASCTTYVPPGDDVTVWGFTPSTWSGWSGDCTAGSHDCDLGTIVTGRTVTATFDRDEREVATLLPSAPVTGLALTPGGDLLVATTHAVARVTLGGTVVWHTTVAGPHDLVTDAAGDVFGIGQRGVFALSPAGVPRWTTPATVGRAAGDPNGTFDSAIAVSADGTVIAALTPDGARVLDGTGADRFTVGGLVPALGLAVAPDGTVGVVTESGIGGVRKVVRYDRTGAALTALDPLPGDENASIAYDATGAICADVTGFGEEFVSCTDASLANVFTRSDSTGASAGILAGVTADSGGDVVAVRGDTDSAFTGLFVQVFSPTGVLTWTHEKVSTEYIFGPVFQDGVLPSALAADANHHVAVAGTYSVSGGSWIQVYAMP